MTPATPARNNDLKAVLILLVAAVVFFHLATALTGHGRFRDIHLGAALHYAQTRIALSNTVIVGFNATDTPTIQELPVWQAVTALVFKALGTWWGWGNVVSLLLFLPCLYPLYHIARTQVGEREALWGLCFFLAEPLVFVESGEASPDGFSLATCLWFLYFSVKLIGEPGLKWLGPAAISGALAATFKLPFFMATGLGAAFYLWQQHGLEFRRLVWLGAAGGFASVMFLLWTHYTDTAQANAVFPLVDLRVAKGTTMAFWYFGDLKYRLSPTIWFKGGFRIFTALLGSFALFGLVVLGGRNKPGNLAAKGLLLGAVVTTLVFFHLVLHHWHYYLMFAPAVAMLGAAGWVAVEAKFSPGPGRSGWLALFAALLLALGLGQGLLGMRGLTFDNFTPRMSALIRQHTDPADKLVIIGGGWGGEELMRSDRRGLSAWDAHIFDRPADLARLKSLGFNKVVLLNESPFQNAIQIVNPGQTDIPRKRYVDALTPQVEGWPTVFQTEDILIKAIP